MIITVTLNPAMDKTITVNNFSCGIVNRVSSIRHDIGGKGINVSKVLNNFETNSICTGFLGGMWDKHFISELNKRDIKMDFVRIKGDIRTNVKVVDTINNVYTDINEPGPLISQAELNTFLNKFKSICNSKDIVVLSGGTGPGIEKDIYAKLINIAKENGAFTILDADGELLKEGIKANPDIIKPNNHELVKLMNLQNDSDEVLIEAGKSLIKKGIKKVLVSLGDKGALYITETNVYKAKALKVPVKSTVGAGDSMVASLAYSIINNYDDLTTLKYAVASGTVSVSLEGTQACSLAEVKSILDKIQIEKEK